MKIFGKMCSLQVKVSLIYTVLMVKVKSRLNQSMSWEKKLLQEWEKISVKPVLLFQII